MSPKIEKLSKWKKTFGWVFSISLVIFFMSTTLLFMQNAPKKVAAPESTQSKSPSDPGFPTLGNSYTKAQSIDFPITILIVSLLTSITSLIGFFSTTILAWKREKREVASVSLDLKKRELEIEKLRRELENSKRDDIDNSA